FMNQIAGFCELVGADVQAVRRGIGSDRRIGAAFLFPGPGYGGSCFPKDVKALVRSARERGIEFDLLEAVEAVNERQKRVLLEKILAALGNDLSGCTVAVWGLAFKAETDDMRESPAITLIEGILFAGGKVIAHDPKARETAGQIFGDRISYAADPYSAVDGADALVVVTEWLVYRNPDFERLSTLLKRRLIIDGRNLYDADRLKSLGFEYHGIGRRHT
ncbi:MAG: UDP binding domain-containing protein, partial [Gemmatimonadales bacterium]